MNNKVFGWSWPLIDHMIMLHQADPSSRLQYLFWAGQDKHCQIVVSHGHIALTVNDQAIYSEPIEHFDGESISNIEGILNGTREVGTGQNMKIELTEKQYTELVDVLEFAGNMTINSTKPYSIRAQGLSDQDVFDRVVRIRDLVFQQGVMPLLKQMEDELANSEDSQHCNDDTVE